MPRGSRAQYSDGRIRRLASSRGRFESHSRYQVSDAFAGARLAYSLRRSSTAPAISTTGSVTAVPMSMIGPSPAWIASAVSLSTTM